MVRSFDCAAYAALFGLASGRGRTTGVVRDEDRPALFPWARAWRAWTHHAFLAGWLEVCEGSSFLPGALEARHILFPLHLIDPILVDIASQLRSGPPPLPIPLLRLTDPSPPPTSPVTP